MDDFTEADNLSSQGYSLSVFQLEKKFNKIVGLKLTFKPDAGGANLQLILGGNGQGTQPTNAITKPVTAFETCNDAATTGFRFHYADETKTDIEFTSCSTTTLTNFCGNFIGLFCSWKKGNGNNIDRLNGCGAIYDGQPFAFVSMSNVSYAVDTPMLTTATYDTNVSSCQTPTFTISYKDAAGALISKPTWLTHIPANRKFEISTSFTNDIAIYSLILSATVAQQIPTSATSWGHIPAASTQFTIEIYHACRDTSLNFRTLNTMEVLFTQSTTQQIWFDDKVAFDRSNPTYCGTRSYSLSKSYSFVGISGTILAVSASAIGDTGTYNLNITVGLVDFQNVAQIIVPLEIIIKCQVTTFTFSLQPSNLIIKVGIDTQPSSIPFSVSKTPNCPQAVNFAFSQTPPGFVSLKNLLDASGEIEATGAVIGDHGSYRLTLLASVDSKNISTSFDVQIVNPCSQAVFQTSPNPIIDMTLILFPSSFNSVVQNVKIYTDIELTNPSIICPITANLTPTKPFALLAADYTNLTIDGQYATLAEAGEYFFILSVRNLVSPSVQKDYIFKVVLNRCAVTQFTFSNTIADFSLKTSLGTHTTSPFQTQQANQSCGYSVTYSIAIVKNLVVIPQPNWLVTDFTQRTLSISQTQKQDVGIYDVKITAQIPQIDPQTSNFSVTSFQFRITITEGCSTTALIKPSFSVIIAKISQGPVTRDLTVYDTISGTFSSSGYCGQKTYTISPTPSFLSLIGSTLKIQSQNPVEAGDYFLTLTVSLQDYPLVASLIYTISVQIQCEVIQIIETQVPQDIIFEVIKETSKFTSFSFQEFPQCGLEFQLTPNDKDFILLDSQSRQIRVSTKKESNTGTYNLDLLVIPKTIGVQRTFPFIIKVISPCLETVIQSSTRIPNIQALVQAKPFYEMPVYLYHTVQNTTDCGAIEASVRDVKTNQTPNWSILEGQKLSIDLQTQTKPIKSQMELVAFLSRYPDTKYVQPFSVTLDTISVQCSPQTTTYEVGGPNLSMQIFYSIQTESKQKLTPVFSANSMNDQGTELDGLPEFVKFIEDSQTFIIQNNNPLSIGEYTVGMKISFKELKNFQTTCTTKLQVNYTPIEDQKLECSVRWVFKMPKYTDSAGADLALEINLHEAKAFLKVQNGLLIYEPVQIVPGDYTIKYTVSQSGLSKEFSFTIKITCAGFLIPEKVQKYEAPIRPVISVKNPPRPYITSINNAGLIKVAFSQQLVIPSYSLYPEFQQPEHMREANATAVWNDTFPEAFRQLALVNQKKGEEEAIEIINRGIVYVNDTKLPLVQLSLIPQEGLSPEKHSFLYKCVSFKETYMEFQAYFTYVNQISARQMDILMVKFNGPQYFRTSDDATFVQTEILDVKKPVPQQLNASFAQQLQKAADLVQGSSKAIVVLNFALNMILSGALQEMLASMKKMQIMIHLLLIEVQIPATCQIFFGSLLKLVTYELIDISPYIRKGLKLNDDYSFSQNFEQLGYQSSYSIILLGNLYIALIAMILGLILFFSTRRFKSSERYNKLRNKLKSLLIWHGTLGLFNESYIVICVGCFVNISMTKSGLTFGETFSLSNACLLLLVVLGYPVLILTVLVKNQPRLHLRKFRNQFGDFYLHFRYKEGWTTVLEPFYSALRRLVQVAAVVFLKQWPVFQFISIFYTWNLVCILNSLSLRYYLKGELYTEMINEFFIVLILYNLLIFTEFAPDPRSKNLMGFSMMVVMLVNMAFNFTLIIVSNLRKLIKTLRTKYLTWKRARLLKKLQAIIEQADFELELQKNIFIYCAEASEEDQRPPRKQKQRDKNWYQAVTWSEQQSPQGGDFTIQLENMSIDYNRSDEGLITIKNRTEKQNKSNTEVQKQTKLQTIEEHQDEESPWGFARIKESLQIVSLGQQFIEEEKEEMKIEDESIISEQESLWGNVGKNHARPQNQDGMIQAKCANIWQKEPELQLESNCFQDKPSSDLRPQIEEEIYPTIRDLTKLPKFVYVEPLSFNTLPYQSRQQNQNRNNSDPIQFYWNTYNQVGDLNDPFAQQSRVKLRQASHRNLFQTPLESQNMFNMLWDQKLTGLDLKTSESDKPQQSKKREYAIYRERNTDN